MRILLACALIACVTAPASAQKVTTVANRVQGRLDSIAEGTIRSHRTAHQFRTARGQIIEVSLNADEFDTVLGLITPRGDTIWNDDAGGDTNSRITTVAVDDGTWNVIVSSYGEGGGAYELSVMLGEIGVVRDLGKGDLSATDSVSIKGYRYDVHAVRIEKPASMMVQVSATGFTPNVIVLSPDGERYVSESDPEGGTAVNVYVGDAKTGNWRIMVTHIDEEENEGTYSVQLVETTALGNLETKTGELTEGDQQHLFGEHVDTYRVRGSAREWTIDLGSDDFDAYLVVRSPIGEWFRNDDTDTGVNASLTLPAGDGNWQVWVSSAMPGELGRYKLTIRRPAAGGEQP